MINLTKVSVLPFFPKRPTKAHKGTFGRNLIVAGSRGMVGAGILSSWGAVKSGAGLVRLATVKSQQVVAAKRCPLEVTTQGLPESTSGSLSSSSWGVLKRTMDKFDPHVIVLGPGLGDSPGVRSVVRKFLGKGPLVLDADGLNVLAQMNTRKLKGPIILTPHPGEMSRMLNLSVRQIQGDREKFVKKAAQKYRAICVLKGNGTLISDGRTVWKNTTGNSGMASGGTGDVLAGMISGFWGQFPTQDTKTAVKAAALAVYLHGLAGDFAAQKVGSVSMTASDLIEKIPKAVQTVFRR